MPLPSDINRDNYATANPFDPRGQNVNAYTAIEIATLQARLNRQLGPEYISTRPGAGGGKLHYLSADKAINLANSVFGFQGWSSSIQQVQVDFVDESASSGKISLGLSIICRVTLKDGTFHEDIGYGHIENCKGKAAAFEKAKKEAATDAMKRALRNFGNVLGNCLYDKEYLAKVSKMKVVPSKFDPDSLHRHPDYASAEQVLSGGAVAEESRALSRMKSDRSARTTSSTIYGEDEFEDDALFEGVPPDAVLLEDSTMIDYDTGQVNGAQQQHNHGPAVPVYRVQPMSDTPNLNGRARGAGMRPPQAPVHSHEPSRPAQQPVRANGHASSLRGGQSVSNPRGNNTTSSSTNDVQQKIEGDELSHVPGGKFMSMSALAKGALEEFDLSKETPSLRRTTGVNSGKSEPITRAAITGELPKSVAGAPQAQAPQMQTVAQPAAVAAAAAARTNFVNPSADLHRRIGMPVAPQSPMSNRGAYKPPSAVKRPAPSETPPLPPQHAHITRPPLSDTTNILPENGGSDVKRPKIERAISPLPPTHPPPPAAANAAAQVADGVPPRT